jgi:hypothetical protein
MVRVITHGDCFGDFLLNVYSVPPLEGPLRVQLGSQKWITRSFILDEVATPDVDRMAAYALEMQADTPNCGRCAA